MKYIAVALIMIFGVSTYGQQEITLENLWQNYAFSTKSMPGFNFMQDGKHYTRLERGKVVKYDLTTGKDVGILLDGDQLAGKEGFDGSISSYSFSSDESKVMIYSKRESIYRRSSKSYSYIYDIKEASLKKISDEKIMYATLNPQGSMVAYVFENNLYVYDIASGSTTQITKDGEKNKIINGSADWVYEEEFSMSQAFSWSPEGNYITFTRFDETEVPEFTMTLYKDELYPEYETFKYPKVGEKNAKVSAHVYNVANRTTHKLDAGDLDDMYIPRVKWTTQDNEVVVYIMNRHQNHLRLQLFDLKSNTNRVLLEEKNKYYIDITDDLTFLDKERFIWSSEKNGYNQLFVYGMDGKEKVALTPGTYDVRSFYGVDKKRELVYYGSAEVSPMENHLYTVKLNGKDTKKITDRSGYNTAQFSSNFDYYVLNHSSATVPPSYTVKNAKHKEVRVIEDNSKFQSHLKDYGLNPVEFFTITTSEGIELNAYMIKPANFNEKKKYPLFIRQYSGPNSQQVTDRWGGTNYFWNQMLAQKGYTVVCVDPRGTGARGEEFRKQTYLQLGKYEVKDHIEAAKYLGSLDYIDADRIGVFGWSYGGYMSSLCITKGADVFKAAIAVAPVTNWKWYDTIYTERYMRTYAENPDGYRENSPIYFADKLKGAYLLVHGIADDNVHYQNSAEMAAALIKANKPFDTHVYPNRNHGIYGDNARIHLYNKMTEFIYENL